MNVLCVHACSSSHTRQQNKRVMHARVQFPMVIRHRSVVRTRKMLRAFLKTCRAVQLLHACVVKFKVSGTVHTIIKQTQHVCNSKVLNSIQQLHMYFVVTYVSLGLQHEVCYECINQLLS